MLNVMSVAGLSILLSTGVLAAHTTAKKVIFDFPQPTFTSRSQISYARAIVGGEDVVHIVKADARRVPYLDVKASDLLISYEYDLKGKMIGRTVWFGKDAVARPRLE